MIIPIEDELNAITSMMRSIYKSGYDYGKNKIYKVRSGEICPECKSKNNKTYDSRLKKGVRIRYKRCLKCFNTWKTVEINDEDIIEFEE